jgi:hypothetical protein
MLPLQQYFEFCSFVLIDNHWFDQIFVNFSWPTFPCIFDDTFCSVKIPFFFSFWIQEKRGPDVENSGFETARVPKLPLAYKNGATLHKWSVAEARAEGESSLENGKECWHHVFCSCYHYWGTGLLASSHIFKHTAPCKHCRTGLVGICRSHWIGLTWRVSLCPEQQTISIMKQQYVTNKVQVYTSDE